MLLFKMIQIAQLLKDLDLGKFFKDGNCNISEMVPNLDHEIIEKLCLICNDKKPVNEIDALAGVAAFFLKLIQEAKASDNMKILVEFLPIPSENKNAILRILGKI